MTGGKKQMKENMELKESFEKLAIKYCNFAENCLDDLLEGKSQRRIFEAESAVRAANCLVVTHYRLNAMLEQDAKTAPLLCR